MSDKTHTNALESDLKMWSPQYLRAKNAELEQENATLREQLAAAEQEREKNARAYVACFYGSYSLQELREVERWLKTLDAAREAEEGER